MDRQQEIKRQIDRLASRSFLIGLAVGVLIGIAVGFAIGYCQVQTKASQIKGSEHLNISQFASPSVYQRP